MPGDYVEIKIDGLKDVIKSLNAVPDNMKRRIIKPALREGAKIIAKDARKRAPRATGTLQRAIKWAVFSSRKWWAVGVVYISHGSFTRRRTGKTIKAKYDAWYWRFVERGHRMVGHRKQGYPEYPNAKSGKKAYLEPAFDATYRMAIAKVEEVIRRNINKLTGK